MEHFQCSAACRVDSAFDRRTFHSDLLLREIQRDTGSDPDLPFYKVKSSQHFRHAMLHLEPHIHFHKPEIAFTIQQKFKRTRADITDLFYSIYCKLHYLFALRIIYSGRGRFLQQLLISSLKRTVTVAETDGVSVLIGEDLQFYSLKDTGITGMLQSGVAINLVQQQADHSSVAMTAIYVGKSPAANAELRNANILPGKKR